ncbi:type IV pilus modification protein PilV [Acinetobacter qingfengensis]|uniref:Type IV pilus modification protein PilV n=2 Tax=Acinetobacter qingfengensis TaxID=1262585 RepID=A0A1E7QXL4_9GAMM|nr:type IV pilus modification protein PilV [Acinetobacter qingfengensis]KAA8731693.1 type IV pilus modification protein PilV [Acinetobacter qingfengensis]OEY91828.1 type IV pilus modification protein PilV [Acinetobacter qingfengensis]
MQHNQKGVGMMEILVALLVLAIAVLGFTALQLRAISSTDEALQKVNAMSLARDLAERIRANRSAYSTYLANLNASTQTTSASKACLNGTTCTAAEMANYDTAQVISSANDQGMKIAMPSCQVSGTIARQCIYVSWNKTQPQDGTADTNCTNGGSYQPTASCVVMELY